MDKFTQAYITAMLWAETDGDDPLDDNYSVDDIDPLSLELIVDDCRRYQHVTGLPNRLLSLDH